MTVLEFIYARLEEDDESLAEAWELDFRDEAKTFYGGQGVMRDDWGLWSYQVPPNRARRETEIKRHILDEALVWGEGCRDVMARYLASAYAEHPDYDQSWLP